MADKISVEDILQIFKGSVIIYNNKPHYFMDIGAGRETFLFDLLKQEKIIVPFDLAAMQNPARRIGMVNLMNSVCYVVRNPVRRMKIGIDNNNISIRTVIGRGAGDLAITSRSFGEAIFGKYPTFKQALKMVGKVECGVAFDRQFAVDSHERVFYKTQVVGRIGGANIEDIIFDDDKKHFSLLLNNNHEKTIPVSWY